MADVQWHATFRRLEDSVTSHLTDTLCTQCGLCCDGSLFADVELAGRAESLRIEALGLDVDVDDDDTDGGLMSLPCRALRGTRCSVYVHRPECCRTFECRLLQEVGRGVVSVADAAERIAEARKRVERVRVLLAALRAPNERLPLAERCAQAIADDGNASREANRRRAELEAAMTALEALLHETFLDARRPSRRRRSRGENR